FMSGFCGAITIFVKLPTGILLLLVFLIMMLLSTDKKRLCIFLSLGYLAQILVFCIMTYPHNIIRESYLGFQFIYSIGEDHRPGYLLTQIKQIVEVFLKLEILIPLILLFTIKIISIKRHMDQRIIKWYCLVGFVGYVFTYSFYMLSHRLYYSVIDTTAFVISLICLGFLVLLNTLFDRTFFKFLSNKLLIFFIIALLVPGIIMVGTGNYLPMMFGYCFMSWFVIIFVLAERIFLNFKQKKIGIFFILGLMIILSIDSICLINTAGHGYYGTMWEQKFPTKINNSTIMTDKTLHIMINSVKDLAQKCGFIQGDFIISLYNHPGFVYAIGGRTPNWPFLLTLVTKEETIQSTEKILSGVTTTHSTFLMSINNGLNDYAPKIAKNINKDFNYCGSVTFKNNVQKNCCTYHTNKIDLYRHN